MVSVRVGLVLGLGVSVSVRVGLVLGLVLVTHFNAFLTKYHQNDFFFAEKHFGNFLKI